MNYVIIIYHVFAYGDAFFPFESFKVNSPPLVICKTNLSLRFEIHNFNASDLQIEESHIQIVLFIATKSPPYQYSKNDLINETIAHIERSEEMIYPIK